ncbi:MAG TPA: hypothetical protein VFD00_00120, partial [Thermoclostridium sp.]|nr:hypothetical protein [Thermoclostridium sp.]
LLFAFCFFYILYADLQYTVVLVLLLAHAAWDWSQTAFAARPCNLAGHTSGDLTPLRQTLFIY